MKTKPAFFLAALAATSGSFVALQANPLTTAPTAQTQPQFVSLEMLARQATFADADESAKAIEALRKAGPLGMNALVAASRSTLMSVSDSSAQRKSGQWKRLASAFEKVGAQHDNWASKLYWFTDLEAAKAEAQKQNKPILSLRLLGNLDEELSCANSRFFRTALYPNAIISKTLSENYILHWQSVRPVPKVTIDFGDSRKIQTTITGNSIHYILDSQGRVLDALPGLYGPGAFSRWLDRVQTVNKESVQLEGEARKSYLANFHQKRSAEIMTNWKRDTAGLPGFFGTPFLIDAPLNLQNNKARNSQQIAQSNTAPTLVANVQQKANAQQVPALADRSTLPPTARNAGALPVSKMGGEIEMLQAFTIPIPRDRGALSLQSDDVLWKSVAAKHMADAILDEKALEVLRSKTARFQIVGATFEKTLAEDTVRNEYSRHTTIHGWLAENPNMDLQKLNARVYSELFLTPDSDPWLGLLPEDAYTGIENDGVSR